jgi:colanic acid biosynthesis glycosyl transferase WcaI
LNLLIRVHSISKKGLEMRFLILTQYYPPEIGAAPTRLPSLAAELQRLGHVVEVVTGLPNYPQGHIFPEYERCFYRQEMRDGSVVHRVWMYAAIGRSFERVLNYGSFALTSLFGLLRASKPDYLFLESPPLFLSVPAVIAARLWGVPLIMNVADMWPDAIVEAGILKEGALVRFLTALESWSYRNATYVNAVTEGIRDCLLHKKSLPPRKILFLPNGVDTTRFQPRPPDTAFKRQLGLEGKKIILWAGTQGQSHALENVIAAANLLRDRPEIHFLFVGDGTAKAQLQQLRVELGLLNVSFHDPVPPDELPSFFSISECGLASLRDIPAHLGARPSKIFPMLASGKPIIFVGRGEGAQLIARAEAGIVVPPGDPLALASAIEGFFAQPEAIVEMGRNGRRFVETNLPWSKLVSDWLFQLGRSGSEREFAELTQRRKEAIPIQRGNQ